MNINKYIKEHSTVSVDKKAGLVTVIMEIQPRKQITYKYEECDASQRVKLTTADIKSYLVSSGMEILSTITRDSIDNNTKLSAVWEYGIVAGADKKSNNINTKKNIKKITKDSLKEIL